MPYEPYERALMGDRRALEQVADLVRPRLRGMARHYARVTGDDADDLQQEAWAGLLEALPALDTTIGSPDQYLLRHARWRMLDAVRRRKARAAAPWPEGDDLPAEGGDPEAVIDRLAAHSFLGSLQGVQRAVLAQLMAGRTWREAGAALGCSSANVAYHMRRIRRRYAEWEEAGPTVA